MLHATSTLWLVAGAVLLGCAVRMPESPAAIWVAIALLVYGVRTLPAAAGLAFLAAAADVAVTVSQRGIVPVPDPAYFAVMVPIAAGVWLPLAIDRIAAPRIAGWASTLVLPAHGWLSN
jgi:hypothetical protein